MAASDAPAAGPDAAERKVRRSRRSAARCRRHHRLQMLDHAGLDEHAGLPVRDRHVEHPREGRAPHMDQPARAIRLLRLHAAADWRAAALRIAFDQRDEAIVEQLLMLGAKTPAGRRMAPHARPQAPVQQDGAGIECSAANNADMLFEGHMRFFVHDDLRLRGRICPEPVPARRSAAVRGQRRPSAASVPARAALDGENAVIR